MGLWYLPSRMTWFASHIYFPATESLVRVFQADHVMRRGLYVVDGLRGVDWYGPEHRHGLPSGGLGVIRELVSANEDEFAFDWFGDDALSWDSFSDETDGVALISASHAFEGREDEGYPPNTVPPAGLLARLKGIATETAVPVAYYFHFTWGGDTEQEVAWVFAKRDWIGVYKDDETTTVVDDSGKRDEPGTVLQCVMREFGVTLRSYFFALHARRFPWDDHRVADD